MSAHTPGPWRLSGGGMIEAPERTVKRSRYQVPMPVAQIIDCRDVPADEKRANAEHIIRACNSHDDLLAACEKMETVMRSWSKHPHLCNADRRGCLYLADGLLSAIRKARGGA